MAPVRIVTDSACDLPQALADELGITIVPLTIRFGDEELVDRKDLTASQFWERCAASAVLPATAAPSPGAFETAFREAAGAGADGVVCINLSGKLSATIEAATQAASTVAPDVRVRVVDSRSITLGLGNIVIEAARTAAAGAGVDDVVAAAEHAAGRSRVYGTLDTLENLKKGGRIGAAQSLLGTMLSIKPVIEVTGGAVEPGPKLRTRTKALRYLVERVASEPAVERLAVLQAAAPDLDTLMEMLEPYFARDRIVVGDIGPVIGTYSGPRAIGVAYLVGSGQP